MRCRELFFLLCRMNFCIGGVLAARCGARLKFEGQTRLERAHTNRHRILLILLLPSVLTQLAAVEPDLTRRKAVCPMLSYAFDKCSTWAISCLDLAK